MTRSANPSNGTNRMPDIDEPAAPQIGSDSSPPHVIEEVRSSWACRPDTWRAVDADVWSDWVWQQQNRLRTIEDLAALVELTPDEKRAVEATRGAFRVGVTPHYAALMDPADPECPIRRQAVPQIGETISWPFELEDPLAEERYMPVAGVITHRYPDRVLFYVSHHCPVYCRHCTRKRKVSTPSSAPSRAAIERGLAYISKTPAVRDVLVSGGDPLTLSNARLAEILERLRAIDHIDVIRLGTRNPVTLPQRIDTELTDILRELGPVYVNTHFNHPREATREAADALAALQRAGCVLGNQMVLLAGVNDDPPTVEKLNRWLLRHGCRPYYMFQADMAAGITHMRTPIRRGLEIVRHLRGRIGGLGVPQFVIDLPDGGGKVALLPDRRRREVARVSPERRVLEIENWQGRRVRVVDVDGPALVEARVRDQPACS